MSLKDIDKEWFNIDPHDDDGMARFAEKYAADLITIALQADATMRRLRAVDDGDDEPIGEVRSGARDLEKALGCYATLPDRSVDAK